MLSPLPARNRLSQGSERQGSLSTATPCPISPAERCHRAGGPGRPETGPGSRGCPWRPGQRDVGRCSWARAGAPVRADEGPLRTARQRNGPGVLYFLGSMATVYEAAGGDDGLLRLAGAWHARVMADEVVSGVAPLGSTKMNCWSPRLVLVATSSAKWGFASGRSSNGKPPALRTGGSGR